jgi:hypothetical protein
MTMTETRPEVVPAPPAAPALDVLPSAPAVDTPPPVTFQRTVLVGIDDPFLTPQAVAAPAPVARVTPRVRLAGSIGSVTFLLLVVAAMAWFRFGDATAIPGSAGPVPTVAITSPAATLADGGTVEITAGPGADIEQVDLFVDGDWTGSDTTAPFTPEWEHRSDGTHELKAKLTDSEGRVRYSEAVEVTVGR